MADNDGGEWVDKCGKTTIRYPAGCAFMCHCDYNHWARPCTWWVACKGTVFTGETTALEVKPDPMPPPKPGHTKIGGGVEAVAKILERVTKRSVSVPKDLKGKVIRKRTFKGEKTFEQIAESLGLRLGDKKRGRQGAP